MIDVNSSYIVKYAMLYMLNKFLQDNKGEFYFAFRLIVGVMFAMHGAEKLGLIGGGTVATGLMLVAGIIALACTA